MHVTGDRNETDITSAVPSESETDRGDRLYPRRSSRLYWHLTNLRSALEELFATEFKEGSGGVLLDFGCGNMPYRPLLAGRVTRYIGCDLEGNRLAECTVPEICDLPFDDGSIDTVLSTQVLEHVEDPKRYLAEAERVLKSGGLLILSTHGVWRFHPDPRDYWRWTSDGLKKVITESGFTIVRFRGIMGPAATGIQLWQDAVLPRVPYRLRRIFTTFLQYLIQWSDKRCSPEARDRDACVYLVLARKCHPPFED